MIDITGKKYNKLTVLGFAYRETIKNARRTYWTCQCECGNIVTLRKDDFAYPRSKTKSCGCLVAIENRSRARDIKTGRFIKMKKVETICTK